MESSKRLLYSRIIFVTGIVLLTTLSILFLYETHQENTSASIVYHSQIIQQSLERVYSTVKERESSLRGSLLTHDEPVQPMDSLRGINPQLSYLDSLLSGNVTQQNSLRTLTRLLRQNSNFNDSITTIAANEVSTDRLRSIMRSQRSGMDSIRIVIHAMQQHETNSADKREMDVQMHTIIATLIGAAASIFSMIVFILAFYFIDQELKRSQLYINESKVLNEKVAEINKELELANRNLQGLNNELGAKNFQLEKYAKELSSFTHITSHDMQEPLRKIEFFTSVIETQESHNLSGEGRKYLEKIKHSVSRMRKLFLSMLEFSLTNTTDNTIEEVDLNEIFSLTLQSLKVYIKDTNAGIESQSLPKVKGIKYQLVQLFENIVSNAIKFRRPDVVPEIQITCKLLEPKDQSFAGLRKDMRYFRIDFEDNGTGFDPKYAEKIFDIFQRLLPRNESYGVGIGLAICRKIAENHGGILLASATPNEGSTFSFFIPANE
jgi:signal transduction histidine kinase